MITYEIIKQLQELKQVIAAAALLRAGKKEAKATDLLINVAFPEEIKLWTVDIAMHLLRRYTTAYIMKLDVGL